MPPTPPGRVTRIGMPAGVIAALALCVSSLAGLADVNQRLAADEAERVRGGGTTMVAVRAQEACKFAAPVRLRQSSPDA